MNKIEENNIPKTKKKKFSVLKIALICFVTIILSVVGFIVITDIIADYPEPTDFYFVRYQFDYDTDTGTSTIYQYDADEDKVYKIGSVPGALARSAVNPEHTHIIGVLSEELVLYDLETNEISKRIGLDELEERAGLEYAKMPRINYDFSDDGNSIYIPMKTNDTSRIYLYNFMSDELALIIEKENMYNFECVGDDIYYRYNKDLYQYNVAEEKSTQFVSDIAIDFTISPNRDQMLICDSNHIYQSKLYVYDMYEQTIRCEEKAYRFFDMTWLGESYVYVETYPGILCDVNPTIKINTSRFGPDKVIYRINGFMKGGTIFLVENPGQ